MSGCGDGFNVGGQVIKTEGCGNNLSNNCSNQKIISNQLSSLDTLTTKVDTLTNRFDEFLCQIIDSEKCIDKTKIGNCKISN